MAGAAAFGRLCVETPSAIGNNNDGSAAAFGRLCVETQIMIYVLSLKLAAAFGRLCVETTPCIFKISEITAAAFGRLCVETLLTVPFKLRTFKQPPSGGCVLKLVTLASPSLTLCSRLRAAVC